MNCLSSRSLRFFEYLLQNPTVSNALFSYSRPDSILSFARTCRHASAVAQSYMRLAFNVNQHFSKWFDDPVAFRRLQQRTGLLVSGSSAVQFMGRFEEFQNSDLDLYVNPWAVQEVGEWLVQSGYAYCHKEGASNDTSFQGALSQRTYQNRRRGHKFETSFRDHDYDERYGAIKTINDVFNFWRPDTLPGRRIQLIVAFDSPMEIILCFHSTCVMNFITHAKAVSLYPRATFVAQKSLTRNVPTGRSRHAGDPAAIAAAAVKDARAKWEERGWSMVSTKQVQNDVSTEFRSGRRYAGDRQSWSISLDMTGLEPDPADDYMSLNSWYLERKQGTRSETDFSTITSPVLKNSYTVAMQDHMSFYFALKRAVEAREKEARALKEIDLQNGAATYRFDALLARLSKDRQDALNRNEISSDELKLNRFTFGPLKYWATDSAALSVDLGDRKASIQGWDAIRVREAMDPNQYAEWLSYTGNKFFVYLFNPHYNYLFEEDLRTALTNISGEERCTIQSPRLTFCPGEEKPRCCLVTGLSTAAQTRILQQGLCKDRDLSLVFFAIPFDPPVSSYIASIAGFLYAPSSTDREIVLDVVKTVISADAQVRSFVHDGHDNIPDTCSSEEALRIVIDSLVVMPMQVSDIRTVWNVYATPPSKDPSRHKAWCGYIGSLSFPSKSDLHGVGRGFRFPPCGHCLSADHTSVVCPYPDFVADCAVRHQGHGSFEAGRGFAYTIKAKSGERKRGKGKRG